MITISARAVLTDIEGTTSSISFVKEVLFPFARRELPGFLQSHQNDPEVIPWINLVATEIGNAPSMDEITAALRRWIDEDRKHTALKALQGMLWKEGYESRAYAAHVYGDAVGALRRWHLAGWPLYVYSSGSVAAQRLFFAHSEAGNLLPLFQGYFDTEIGAKRVSDSYRCIVAKLGLSPTHVVFLSDVVEELDAAREAGLQTVLVDRPQDYPQARLDAADHDHPRVVSFDDIHLDFVE